MHRQSIPQLVPHIPSLAYRPFFWLWCLLKSNFHPGRVPVAPLVLTRGSQGYLEQLGHLWL